MIETASWRLQNWQRSNLLAFLCSLYLWDKQEVGVYGPAAVWAGVCLRRAFSTQKCLREISNCPGLLISCTQTLTHTQTCKQSASPLKWRWCVNLGHAVTDVQHWWALAPALCQTHEVPGRGEGLQLAWIRFAITSDSDLAVEGVGTHGPPRDISVLMLLLSSTLGHEVKEFPL